MIDVRMTRLLGVSDRDSQVEAVVIRPISLVEVSLTTITSHFLWSFSPSKFSCKMAGPWLRKAERCKARPLCG